MKKLTLALVLAGGMALPYSVFAADQPLPPDQSAKPPPTQQAPAAKPGAEGRPASSMFDQLDANKDGFIDSGEVAKSATVKANGKAMDLDGDGKISHSEWDAFEAAGSRGH